MNCRAVQTQLLIEPDPSRPAENLLPHLEECAACRQWQSRLVQVERNVPFLPVPPSRSQKEFLGRFLSGAEGSAPVLTARGYGSGVASSVAARLRLLKTRLTDPRRRSYAVAGLAVSLLMVLVGAWIWLAGDRPLHVRVTKKAPLPDPFLAGLFQCDLRLAVAETSRARVEALADLADGLGSQIHAAVDRAPAEDLEQLVALFDQVVREGVLPGARSLPADERDSVLRPIAKRLARAGRDAERLSHDVAGASGGSLRVVVAAAREADDQLRALVAEAVP